MFHVEHFWGGGPVLIFSVLPLASLGRSSKNISTGPPFYSPWLNRSLMHSQFSPLIQKLSHQAQVQALRMLALLVKLDHKARLVAHDSEPLRV